MALSKPAFNFTPSLKLWPLTSKPQKPKKLLVNSPTKLGPFGHFHLIIKPNGMRHSLQSMGTMYDRLNTKTIKIQPMPTFMSRLLPEVNKLVYTKDENLIKFIMQREDRYPRRAGYLSHNMQSIQKDLGIGQDLFSSDGEEWSKHRRQVNKQLMTPSEVNKFTPVVNQVALDYVTLIKHITSKKKEPIPTDLKDITCRLSFETTAAILYGVRMGMLNKNVDINSPASTHFQKYATSFNKLFEMFRLLSFCPVKLTKTLGYLWYKKASRLYTDTVVQSRHFADQATRSSNSKCVWAKLVQKARAIIKETQRLYPLVGFYPRQPYSDITYHPPPGSPSSNTAKGGNLAEHHLHHHNHHHHHHDNESNALHIEKGTIIFIDNFNYGRDPEYFQNPLDFRPERWMRNSENSQFDKNRLFLAFGSGPRSCVGRRISELEMQIILIQLVKNFWLDLESHECYAAKPVYIGITIPDKTPKIRFTPR
ncbi:cytochrome P450 27C1-like [Convolutriloba macropyga]|uniref:cytochrome P450 27C1-like n=1 Tax=Convolutriloba macropyga TaxID=536237 RepID=UPI003F5217B1